MAEEFPEGGEDIPTPTDAGVTGDDQGIAVLNGDAGAVLLVGADAAALGREVVARRRSPGRVGVLVASPDRAATGEATEEMLHELFDPRPGPGGVRPPR
jgi:hypothetical protein